LLGTRTKKNTEERKGDNAEALKNLKWETSGNHRREAGRSLRCRKEKRGLKKLFQGQTWEVFGCVRPACRDLWWGKKKVGGAWCSVCVSLCESLTYSESDQGKHLEVEAAARLEREKNDIAAIADGGKSATCGCSI